MSHLHPQVLIAEEDERARRAVAAVASGLRWRVTLAATAAEIVAHLRGGDFDVAVCGESLLGLGGETVPQRLAAEGFEIPVLAVLTSAQGDRAAEALRGGALEVLLPPIEEALTRVLLHRTLEGGLLRREAARLRREAEAQHGFGSLIAESEAMQSIVAFAREVAPSNATILVTGEPGTGREHLARAIHLASPRSRGPFVAINVARVPETLLESELFGHERGAFTGAAEARRGRLEEADGGTIFLDEVGGMPRPAQEKFLRFLLDGRFQRLGAERGLQADARVIAATHHNLRDRVREGAFSENLFTRLNIFPIEIPPLRERREDIAALAAHFLARACDDMGKRIPRVHERTHDLLEAHGWPGNARELRSVVEAAVMRLHGEVLTPDLLPAEVRGAGADGGDAEEGARLLTLPRAGLRFEALEKDLLIQAMERARGNKSKAATFLGLSRATLRYRLEKHGLE